MTRVSSQIRDAVREYIALGWAPVRLLPCSKRPRDDGWPSQEYDPDEFQPDDNVGIALGARSGGLVDVDLDCREAISLAPVFLPATLTFGRETAPRSHWLYRCATSTRKPAKAGIELRSTGTQTVFPPSVHADTGEAIRWYDTRQPAQLDERDLVVAWARLGAATAIARSFPPAEQRSRHDTTLALAGALWHEGWTLEQATSLLLPALALTDCDLPHHEANIRDTWEDSDRNRYGWPTLEQLLDPRALKTIRRFVDMVPSTPRATAEQVEQALAGQGYALSDAGNADRFEDHYGDRAKYVRGLGWIEWRGDVWAVGMQPVTAMLKNVRTIQRIGQEAGDAAVFKWGQASESWSRLKAAIDIAKNRSRTEAAILDADPWLLCCANGTLDLRSGVLRDHNQADMITRQIPIEYDPTARAPRFLQFLSEIFRGDVQLVEYMIRFLGYCLTARTDEQIFQVWHGDGSNGKSTLIEIMLALFGSYGQKMPHEMLVAQRANSNGPSPSIARLRGIRFAAGAETSEGMRWNEALAKELSGTDTITARHLYGEPIEITPTWKFLVAVNHKPIVRGQDTGIWRRIHLVPFLEHFGPERRDPQLFDRLLSELPGILAALVVGCKAWQRDGLQPPPAVLAATRAYRRGQDVIGAFLEEKTTTDERFAGTPAPALFRTYRQWCAEGNEYQHGRQAFRRVMTERGLVLSGGRWLGLRLRQEQVTF